MRLELYLLTSYKPLYSNKLEQAAEFAEFIVWVYLDPDCAEQLDFELSS
jgi:hypothetical protein